jgi:hypothetical protein
VPDAYDAVFIDLWEYCDAASQPIAIRRSGLRAVRENKVRKH